MEFDFCCVASWSEDSNRRMIAWARELGNRGRRAAVLSPVPAGSYPEADVPFFSIPELAEQAETRSYPSEIESRYGIPSLDHLSFTERKYFSLTRSQSVERAVDVTSAIEELLSQHSIRHVLQSRGGEIHRFLVYYLVNAGGGVSIWTGFSPFEETFSIQTTLDGSWATYRTIPYDEIPADERERVETHIDDFLTAQKFYSHESGDGGGGSTIQAVRSLVGGVVNRTRPGAIHDQLIEEARLKVNSLVNDLMYPSVKASQELCQRERYVFFPLQYPIESRLTVFSPQFYRQEFLVEYLRRILPSSVSLFVKPHPSHPGRLDPLVVRKYREAGRVRFLHPGLSAHEAIANSEGVIVTNNTVGFETLYHRKSLITLGSAFYSDTPAAITVTDLGELPERLPTYLSDTTSIEDTVSSIYSLREASHYGDRVDLTEENVEIFIGSILEFVEDRP